MHNRPANYFWWSIYWLFLIVSFGVIGFLLVSQATGYRYNQHVGRWQKTGMILVSNAPADSELIVDGKSYPIIPNFRLPNVLPGTYNIRITKLGYNPWDQSITVDPGFVVRLDPITLYLKKPVELPVTSKEEDLILNTLPDDQVRIVDSELWYGTHLVSRFGATPTNAILLPSRREILYTLEKQIRVIDINGQHDQLLFERDTDQPTPLAIENDSILIFKDDVLTRALKIK